MGAGRLFVHFFEFDGGEFVALGGGLFEVGAGFVEVFAHAVAVAMQDAHVELGGGGACGGFLAAGFDKFTAVVRRDAEGGGGGSVFAAVFDEGGGKAELGGFFVHFSGVVVAFAGAEAGFIALGEQEEGACG